MVRNPAKANPAKAGSYVRNPAKAGSHVLLALLLVTVAVRAQGPAKADVTPLIGSDSVHAGTPVRVAVQVRLPEGYHVNSNKPRESYLIPVSLTIENTPGVTAAEIVFPEPIDITQKDQTQPLRVFQHDFAIGLQLNLAADVPAGDLDVPARLRYQACDEKMCYFPVVVQTSWTLKVVPAATPLHPAHADVFDRIAFGHGESPSATAAASPSTPSGGTASTTPVSPVSFDDFTVIGTAGGYLNANDFIQVIKDAESGVKQSGPFEGQGPIAILLAVFLGGLALNLTPCVLPMIPINLAIIGAGSRSGSSRGRGFMLGATYGAGMAIVYGVLGLVVILTAGTFGTINSSPWFNAGIAALFVLLALAMFDVIVIDFSRFSSSLGPSGDGASRGTFLVALSMGSVAALLAGACVAPIVIQVVLFASTMYAAGTSVALALPFVLGLGMATPWPIAGAGIAALPKPGAWMVRIKQVFGIIVLATAVYYGYEAYQLFSNRWADPAEVSATVDAQLKEGWQSSLDAGLAEARRDRKPVLIDIWATWCKNCQLMGVTTFKDPAVTSALSGYVKIKFQAEDPEQSPAKEVMSRFGAVGLPTYVILRPK